MTQFRDKDSGSKYFEEIPRVTSYRRCKNCKFVNNVMKDKKCRKCGVSFK